MYYTYFFLDLTATSQEQMLILLCQLHVVWRSNSIIWRISEVTLCLLWLVLRWVTLRVSVPSWYVASQQGQLCPSRVANLSTSIGWHVSFCSGEDDCKLLSSIYFALLSAFRHECLNSTSLVVCHHYWELACRCVLLGADGKRTAAQRTAQFPCPAGDRASRTTIWATALPKITHQFVLIVSYATVETTTALRPLYRSTCISRHLQLKMADFVGAKFYCPHALAGGSEYIGIREKTLVFSFSSTVLCSLIRIVFLMLLLKVMLKLMPTLRSTNPLYIMPPAHSNVAICPCVWLSVCVSVPCP